MASGRVYSMEMSSSHFEAQFCKLAWKYFPIIERYKLRGDQPLTRESEKAGPDRAAEIEPMKDIESNSSDFPERRLSFWSHTEHFCSSVVLLINGKISLVHLCLFPLFGLKNIYFPNKWVLPRAYTILSSDQDTRFWSCKQERLSRNVLLYEASMYKVGPEDLNQCPARAGCPVVRLHFQQRVINPCTLKFKKYILLTF